VCASDGFRGMGKGGGLEYGDLNILKKNTFSSPFGLAIKIKMLLFD
jgi:hypothetical protein